MSNYKEHAAMVDSLCKPGHSIIYDLTAIKAERLHMAVGLSGEVGELAAAYVDASINDKMDSVNLQEELGDIEFYLEGLHQVYGIETMQPTNAFYAEVTNDIVLLSIVASVGDVLDMVKKEAVYNKVVDSTEINEALLKVRVHLDDLYTNLQNLGITRESARDANLEKLLKGANARYKEGSYSNQAAQERADKKV